MRRFRSRTSVFASIALTWQIVALMLVPTAACGRPEASSSEMANCPMHHSTQGAACPMHAQGDASHDCECPRLGCAPSVQGFLALLGPIGVLPAAPSTIAPDQITDALPVTASSRISLAPVPASPPPRL